MRTFVELIWNYPFVTLVQWYIGTLVFVTLVQWYIGTLVYWYNDVTNLYASELVLNQSYFLHIKIR